MNMATKLGVMVIYYGWFLPLESHDMSTTTMPMATDRGRVRI